MLTVVQSPFPQQKGLRLSLRTVKLSKLAMQTDCIITIILLLLYYYSTVLLYCCMLSTPPYFLFGVRRVNLTVRMREVGRSVWEVWEVWWVVGWETRRKRVLQTRFAQRAMVTRYVG